MTDIRYKDGYWIVSKKGSTLTYPTVNAVMLEQAKGFSEEERKHLMSELLQLKTVHRAIRYTQPASLKKPT